MTDIFRTVLNMSIAGTYAAAAVTIMRLAMKRLPRRCSYALWIIVGIRLVCPFSFSSPISLFNLFMPETTGNQMAFIPNNIEYSRTPQVVISIPPVNQALNDRLMTSFAPNPAASVNPLQIVLFIAAWVWLAGVLVMLLYTLLAYLSVRKKVASSMLYGENIFQCETVSSPFVYGIFNPRIYLPDNIPEHELPYILAHESAHIKRGDHLVKLLAMGILCLHWFNPLVWISYHLMTMDMEVSCDEKAVKGFKTDVRKDYANTLLNMSARQNGILGGVLSFGETSIKHRIKNILKVKKMPAFVTIIAAVAIFAAAVLLLTNPASRDTEAEHTNTFSITKDVCTLAENEFYPLRSPLQYTLIQTGEQVLVTFSMPDGWTGDSSVFSFQNTKIMELFSVQSAAESLPREWFTIDEAYGNEVVVLEEEHYTDSGLVYNDLYHIKTYTAETESGIYENYKYIIRRGDYSLCVSFVVNEYFDRELNEEILKTFRIEK